MSGLRLIPIVLIAAVSLLALKAVGFVAGGGSTRGSPAGAQAQDVRLSSSQRLHAESASPSLQAPGTPPRRSWAQDVLGYPEITGSTGGDKKSEPPAEKKDAAPPAQKLGRTSTPLEGKPVTLDGGKQMSAGERAVLDRLQERRQELEERSRELDIREGLLRTAEKRLEARLAELKRIEAQVKATAQQKDEAEATRFKGLVTMYENMKAKEAARIFDRLDPRVLIEVAASINPRRMSDILAQMTPEAAERLTVELAARAAGNGSRQPAAETLPKIVGRPRT